MVEISLILVNLLSLLGSLHNVLWARAVSYQSVDLRSMLPTSTYFLHAFFSVSLVLISRTTMTMTSQGSGANGPSLLPDNESTNISSSNTSEIQRTPAEPEVKKDSTDEQSISFSSDSRKRSGEQLEKPTAPRIPSLGEPSDNLDVPSKSSPAGSGNGSTTGSLPSSAPGTPMKNWRFYGCTQLSKDYDMLDKLGEGTFGEVHKAKQKSSGGLVALKRIFLHNEKEGFPLTALREIRILKSLDHKNILPLIDMAVQRGDRAARKKGSVYMVSPYMDHDMAGLLANPKVHLQLPHIKCYMKQLLEGINYLHQQNYLHRDIKTANILIDNRGHLLIADFGLARCYEEDPPKPGQSAGVAQRSYTGMVVTRWYRPPELILGESRYTTAIDMWGIGCVLGEMFRRVPILQGNSDTDQGHRIFQLLGSPNNEVMPGWDKLPGANITYGPYKRTFEGVFSDLDWSTQSLLSGLLTMNPQKRLTALGALDHRFFYTEPYPCAPEDLPQYEASHELDSRKSQKERKPNTLPEEEQEFKKQPPLRNNERGNSGRNDDYTNHRYQRRRNNNNYHRHNNYNNHNNYNTNNNHNHHNNNQYRNQGQNQGQNQNQSQAQTQSQSQNQRQPQNGPNQPASEGIPIGAANLPPKPNLPAPPPQSATRSTSFGSNSDEPRVPPYRRKPSFHSSSSSDNLAPPYLRNNGGPRDYRDHRNHRAPQPPYQSRHSLSPAPLSSDQHTPYLDYDNPSPSRGRKYN